MIFNAIITSFLRETLPPAEIVCHHRPFVAELSVQSKQLVFFLYSPLGRYDRSVQVVVVTELI